MSFNNVPHILQTQAEKYQDKKYLIFNEKEITYQGMRDHAAGLANYLANDLGIGARENIGILLPNGVEFVVSFFGVMFNGSTSMPYNTLLKSEELLYQINHSEVKVLITTPNLYKVIKPIRDQLERLEKIIFVEEVMEDGGVEFWQAVEAGSKDTPKNFVDIKSEDIASMIYTSGTTGHPKACMLSHGNYIADLSYVVPRIELAEEDTNMCIMPLFHVNGQVASVLATMWTGGTLVLEEMFKPRTFIPTLKKYKCSSFSAVPAMYNFLNEMPEYKEGEDLSFLKACICGAAPMPVEVFNKFERKFKGKIIEGYGLSEGTCVSSLNPLHGERKIGSIGTPLEGQEMAIMDASNKPLADGEIGEIVVKGANVMQGYFKNEEATSAAIVDGWLHTGDMGYRDQEGYYFITGRKKEMIIRGGENIYPKEIEEALYEHEGIMECAVIGLPDKKYGEQVVAVIRLKEGANENARSMRTYLKPKIANYKMPAKFEFVLDLPKTSTGKIQKVKLRDEFIGDQQSVKRIKENINVPYKWAYGQALSHFFTELKENKKLWGLKSSQTGKVYCPPKIYDGVTFSDCDEWVELSDVATLQSFSTVHMSFPGQPKEPPYVIAWVIPDGAHTTIYHILNVEDEEGLEVGMKVKAVWRPDNERIGTIYDIAYYEPVK